MGAKTGISWTDATWNPLRGCSRVSQGCVHCYAEVVAERYSGPGQPYAGLAHRVNGHATWTNKVAFFPHKLVEPLQWQEPRRVFVNSMSDFWHPDVELAWQAQMYAVMALTPRHTYQILTKRPEAISPMLHHPEFTDRVRSEMATWRESRPRDRTLPTGRIGPLFANPLPNVWIGTSVENQDAANTRIPHLMLTPAAIRFLSVEPLLAPVSLNKLSAGFLEPGRSEPREVYPLLGLFAIQDVDWEVGKIDWVIVGGESGPGFRPMDLAWAHDIRNACALAGTPFFFKQVSALRSGQGADALGRVYHEFPEVQDV